MRVERLPYITLWAHRFDDTKKLYGDVLGLPIIEENPNFILFDTRSSKLALHRLSKGPKLDRRTVELHLQVNDVDEVYLSLQRRGVKFESKPANMPWGTRSAIFRDPEGYEIEIIGPQREDQQSQK